MAIAGVNLRVEDINNFKNACADAGIDPSSIPVLAILHDDDDVLLSETYNRFSGLNVKIYRCMSPNSQLPIRPANGGGVPLNSELIGWNEQDEDQSWWDSWWQQVRAQRPDIKIHYGAPNTNNEWTRNDPLQSALNYADWHIGSTFSPPPSTTDGKPSVVTEVDIDPSRFSVTQGPYPWGTPEDMDIAYTELVNCAKRCVTEGIDVYVWGIDATCPDAAYCPFVLKALSEINNSPIVEPEVATDPKSLAEQAYNKIASGAFIPGKQYVQDNYNGTFTVVATFPGKSNAEIAYNDITGGKPFIGGGRYVQQNSDFTYSVVVTFPLAD